MRRTLPFGSGARACIGMPLAQLILPTTIATLLGQFQFRLADHVGGLRDGMSHTMEIFFDSSSSAVCVSIGIFKQELTLAMQIEQS